MKKLIVMVLVFLSFGVVADAHAEGVYFVERPDFMQQSDELICYLPSPGNVYNTCEYDEFPRWNERVLLSNNGEIETHEWPVYQTVHCQDGFCEGSDFGYAGQIDRTVIVTLPSYYYIWGGEMTEEGELRLVVYKRGTGPAADTFNAYRVKGGASVLSSSFTLDNYEGDLIAVVCGERAVTHRECKVTVGDYRDRSGDNVQRAYFSVEDIRDAVHFADLSEEAMANVYPGCANGQCRSFKGHFLGLDPNFPLWQE